MHHRTKYYRAKPPELSCMHTPAKHLVSRVCTSCISASFDQWQNSTSFTCACMRGPAELRCKGFLLLRMAISLRCWTRCQRLPFCELHACTCSPAKCQIRLWCKGGGHFFGLTRWTRSVADESKIKNVVKVDDM